DGLGGERQARRDLLDAPADAEQAEDLELALGQRLVGRAAEAAAPGRGELRREGGARVRAAGVDPPDGVHELLGRALLGEVADGADPVGLLEDAAEPDADDGVVVGHEHADHGGPPAASCAASGRRTVTVVPPSATAAIATSLPKARARSRMPTMPTERALRAS